MKTTLKISSAVLMLVLSGLLVLWLRSDVEPVVWQPAPLPGLDGEFEPSGAFEDLEKIVMPEGIGPEDVAIGSDGWLYTGVSDGRILRFRSDRSGGVEEVANTQGRPLGLQFDSNGNLVIADAVKGLLTLSPDRQLNLLSDTADGRRMRFVDDLDIAADGTIWFSDASTRFAFPHVLKDFLEASATGRLLSYSPLTGQTTVHLDGLFFANGVALGPNDNYVLVNETGTGRIHRLWLAGEQAGQRDLFHQGLPGNPDNLSYNDDGLFWVALVSIRDAQNEKLSDNPLIRKIVGGLHLNIIPIRSPVAFAVGLNLDGEVEHVLLSRSDRYHSVTSVNQLGERLYLGSLQMDSVAITDVPHE